MGEQFSEKDRAFIDQAIRDVNVPYGETIIIKRYTGIANTGDPARGIQPIFSFSKTITKAIVDLVTPQDILYSGGLYQSGDIKVSLREQLNFADTVNQIGGKSEGDHIVYRSHEYRIVGRFDPETLIGHDKVFLYVFRKIGNI